jgi:hypothetical protein
VDGRVRVLRYSNSAFHAGNLMGTITFVCGGVTAWDAFPLIVSYR